MYKITTDGRLYVYTTKTFVIEIIGKFAAKIFITKINVTWEVTILLNK